MSMKKDSNKRNYVLGIIGLGKMGGNLSLQAIDKGIIPIGKSRSSKPDLTERGVSITNDYEKFITMLSHPRVIYLSLPAGKTIDIVLDELFPYLEKGDVIMDGGNSFYLDSIEREQKIWKENEVYFLDCGTSGGLDGARHGACFMVGGQLEGFKIAQPILSMLAVNDDACIYTGKPGSGHFVKLVHNGIEFGMLQAIGEGVALLRNENDFELNLENIFKNWSNGSVIRGWLIELMEKGLREDKFDKIESYIEDTGEVNWLIQDAINKEIPIPIMSQSIMELFKSRTKDSDIYRAIALMRNGFGGHPFGKDEYISKERKFSRINKI